MNYNVLNLTLSPITNKPNNLHVKTDILKSNKLTFSVACVLNDLAAIRETADEESRVTGGILLLTLYVVL